MDIDHEGMMMERKRQGCLSILLVLGIIGSSLSALMGLGIALWVILTFATTRSTSIVLPEEIAWMAPLVTMGIAATVIGGMLAIGQLVSLMAIWQWKRWGLYLLGAVALLSVIQNVWTSTQFGQSGNSAVLGILITFLAFGLVAAFVLARWRLYD
jgi:hypothetical protein